MCSPIFNSMHLYAFDSTKFVLMDVVNNRLFLTIETGKGSLNKWFHFFVSLE